MSERYGSIATSRRHKRALLTLSRFFGWAAPTEIGYTGSTLTALVRRGWAEKQVIQPRKFCRYRITDAGREVLRTEASAAE